jgi:membrane protein
MSTSAPHYPRQSSRTPPSSRSSATSSSQSRRRKERRHARAGSVWSNRLSSAWQLSKATATQWLEHESYRLAASLALFTLLSIAPLLVITVAVAGMVFGAEAARGQISSELSAVVGPHAGEAIQSLVANARTPSSGIQSSVIGLAVLLFGASGVFGELQSTLNFIWDVKAKPGRGLRGLLRDRFWSFTMVMGVAFLLLVSLVVSAALTTIAEHLRGAIPLPALWEAVNLAAALAATSLIFTLIFKVVPDVKIAWRHVWVGGIATALAFGAGKTLLAWYIGRSATVSPFGAAGSLVALVLWVYYSAQILFFGAEFTQVYAMRRGAPLVPTSNATRIHTAADGHASQGESLR